jgi:hypothetical protein
MLQSSETKNYCITPNWGYLQAVIKIPSIGGIILYNVIERCAIQPHRGGCLKSPVIAGLTRNPL